MRLSKRSSLFSSSLNCVIHINVINIIILWGRARVFTNLYQEYKANFSQFKTETKTLKRKKGTRSRHGHKYSKCKKCLSMMMLICIKQHLSDI